jgi:uncharacterized protein
MHENLPIEIPRDLIAAFCRQYHIRNWIPGFLRLAGMELELSEIVGRKVDLRTPFDLSRYFRQEVLDSAVVQYVQE